MKSDSFILVVEDDIDLQESLRFVLEAEGYRVECAADGSEALSFLERSEICRA